MGWHVSRVGHGPDGCPVLVEADYVYLSEDEARTLAAAILDVAERRTDDVDGWSLDEG